jgi:Glycosyltransferase family 87
MSKRWTVDRAGKSQMSRAAHSTRDFVLFCCAAVAVCVVLKIPSLFYPRTEGDERIYWQLAQNLAAGGDYTLRGTPLLKEFSPYMYDRPLFHHPPLFAMLLTPFASTGSENAAVVISWLGHALVVLAVAIVGRRALFDKASDATLTSPVFWLPVLGVAADPLLMFVSRRIWIDSLLAGLVAVSVALLITATGARRRVTLVAAGAFLGLAGLAKLTALILVPVFLFACVRDEDSWTDRVVSATACLLPAALFVVPWLVVFYLRTGVLVPQWVKPDAALMNMYPFVRVAVERPWFYYIVKLALIMPLAVVAIWALVNDSAVWKNRTIHITASWFMVFLGVLTILSINGYGFQMRHIAPAVGALYVAVLMMLIERERPLLLMVCSFAMLVGTVTGAMHLMAPQFDEIVSLARFAGLMDY